MLIRARGYNDGVKEYLEEGQMQGREMSRDELDERVILYGDLDLTQRIYQSIPDRGQTRYLSYTLAFREDLVPPDVLFNAVTEFKQFLLHAYNDDEINFYAEAHLPKVKQIVDKKTGEFIDRKPHIHIIIPKKNLYSGNIENPAGMHTTTEKYMEAFQEYINQKYNLASPRDHVRADLTDPASVLSRYKGDDFYGKNREFKQGLVKTIIERGITSRKAFYDAVAEHGPTRIRNEGKENEYIAVKLPDDAKYTNLKDTIFQDGFIVNRELKKPPLEKRVIQERLLAWPQVARELKYVNKATPSFRKHYKGSSEFDRLNLLKQREHQFYKQFGVNYVGIPSVERPGDSQRSTAEADPTSVDEPAGGLQDLSGRSLADDGEINGQASGALLLPDHARVHVESAEPGRDPGLRTPLQGGGRRRTRRRPGRPGLDASIPETANGRGVDGKSTPGRSRDGLAVPPYGRNPFKVSFTDDIEAFSSSLLKPMRQPVDRVAAMAERAQTRSRSGTARPLRKRADDNRAPYSRSLHRVANVSDIEANSRRLFGPERVAVEAPSADPNSDDIFGTPPSEPVKRTKKRKAPAARAIPPYAKNSFRVAEIAEVEAYTKKLFGPLVKNAKPEQFFKVQKTKPIAVGRSASTVAAYFNRAHEQSLLLPAQRRAIRKVDRQFYELRRFVFSDDRLTRKDKAQLFSVLQFERLKVREAIQQPDTHREVIPMASPEIRAMYEHEDETFPSFTISGPGAKQTPPVRDRLKLIFSNLSKRVDPEVMKEQERVLSAHDLYTKKARFSQNVHYIDKKTDRTVFVDTGKAIALRRTGLTEAGVTLALQMAQQRFGSTLTINGNAQFKHFVVEAAAKNGMDIHFTDKAMNERLAARREELQLEKDFQTIEQPAAADLSKDNAATVAGHAPASVSPVTQPAQAQPAQAKPAAEKVTTAITVAGQSVTVDLNDKDQIDTVQRQLKFEMVAQDDRISGIQKDLQQLEGMNKAYASGMSPEVLQNLNDRITEATSELVTATQMKDAAQASLSTLGAAVSAAEQQALNKDAGSTIVQSEQRFTASTGLTQPETMTEAVLLKGRAEEHAVQLVYGGDTSDAGIAVVNTYMASEAYRNAFAETVVDLSSNLTPALTDEMQASAGYGLASKLIAEAEAKYGAAVKAAPATATDPKVHRGVLLNHGEANYLHDPKKGESYFVEIHTEQGPRTIWGVGLRDALESGQFEKGQSVRLQDLGTEPVRVKENQPDGTVIEKDGFRRSWEVDLDSPAIDTPSQQTAAEFDDHSELDRD